MFYLLLFCAALFTGSLVLADDAASDLVPLKPKLPAAAVRRHAKDVAAGSNIESASDKSSKPLLIPRDARKHRARLQDHHERHQRQTGIAHQKSPTASRKPTTPMSSFCTKARNTFNSIWAVRRRFSPSSSGTRMTRPKSITASSRRSPTTPEFTANVRTMFNNDQTNAAGRGLGTDREYFESFEGKTIDAKGAKARYVRLYFQGAVPMAPSMNTPRWKFTGDR